MTSASTASTPVPPVPAELAPVEQWPPLRELTAETSQQIFHALMEAFSRPGLLHRLPADAVPPPVPPAVAPLLALTDIMTPIAPLADGSSPAAATPAGAIAAIARLTGAPVVDPARARFALALAESADLGQLSPGTHWTPEDGAFLVQRVAALTAVDPRERTAEDWRLHGPGIPHGEHRVLRVAGPSARWRAQRARLTSDYPAGIDCLLVTDEGTVTALPRTTEIEAH